MAPEEFKLSAATNTQNATENPESALLCTLNDDLILTILSFLVDLPWDSPPRRLRRAASSLPGDDDEENNNRDEDNGFELRPSDFDATDDRGNPDSPRCDELTAALPLVCKSFYKFCHHPTDFLWRFLLERLMRKEPFLWEDACNSLIEEYRTTVGSAGETQRFCGTDGLQQRRNGGDNDDENNDASNGDGERMQQSAHGSLSASNDNDSTRPGRPDAKKVINSEDKEAQRRTRLLDETCTAMVQLVAHDRKYQRVPATPLRASQPKVDSSIVRASFRTTPQGGSTCQCVIRHIVTTYMRYTKPVFYMPSSLRIGRDFGLHFFEPRYRLLIAEIMQAYPLSARRGEPIQLEIEEEVEIMDDDEVENEGNGDANSNAATDVSQSGNPTGWRNFLSRASSSSNNNRHRRRRTLRRRRLPPPCFVYAHEAPLLPNSPAFLVQVRRCVIHPDGRADVLLVPTAYVLIERLRIRENSGGLYEAQVRRLGRAVSERLEGGPIARAGELHRVAVGGNDEDDSDDNSNVVEDDDDDNENGRGGGGGFGQVHQDALQVLHGAFVQGPDDVLRLLEGAIVQGPDGREIRIPMQALLMHLAAHRNEGGADNENDDDDDDEEEAEGDEHMNRAEE